MKVDKLENKLSSLMPLKHFVFTGYSRNAFYLIIKAFGWDSESEIIIPAFTCSIIPTTIETAGVIAVAVDSEENGFNIDPDKIEEAITNKTKAIYVIHSYGTAAKIEKICNIAKKYNLIVIEDLAHSLFAKYNGKQLGAFGDFALLCFTKKIINFEGGALGTNNTTYYNKILSVLSAHKKRRIFSSFDLFRFVAALWETKFSTFAMLLLKFTDISNNLNKKGKNTYGMSIEFNKFYMHYFAKLLCYMQLNSLFTKCRDNKEYLLFKKKYSNRMVFPELNQTSDDTSPLYNIASPVKKNYFDRIFSYRTWINYNESGKYPRADLLYSNYRIYCNLIKLFL